MLDNIILATVLVKNYHKDSITPRCALKIDISKAFDTVRWDFVISILQAMSLPDLFISWIQSCMSTATFSVALNGEVEGFFSSSPDLRQGCSLSPCLFDLANNVLSLLINKAAREEKIGYHPMCKDTLLTHLSFDDDIIVFTDGKASSLGGVMEVLEHFGLLSGLRINTEKSSLFIAGNTNADLINATTTLGFPIAQLPIRYLGPPLTTKSMTRLDYEPLIDRIRTTLLSWANKMLSYAGRVQLIKTVIGSTTNFWVDSMCSAFLWSGSLVDTKKIKNCLGQCLQA